MESDLNKLEYAPYNQGCSTPIYAFIIICIVVVLGVSGCSTKKQIVTDTQATTHVVADTAKTEKVKADSTSVKHTTNTTEKEKTEKETKVEKSDSTVVTVDANGNVVKQETWHKEKETVSNNREYEKTLLDSLDKYRWAMDSLLIYKNKCDSLAFISSHKEQKVTEKIKIPKIYTYALIFSIIIIIFAIYRIIRWLRTIL